MFFPKWAKKADRSLSWSSDSDEAVIIQHKAPLETQRDNSREDHWRTWLG